MPPKAAAAEPEPEPEPEPEEPQEGASAFTFTDGSKYEGAWVIKEGKKLRHGHGVFIDANDAGDKSSSSLCGWLLRLPPTTKAHESA